MTINAPNPSPIDIALSEIAFNRETIAAVEKVSNQRFVLAWSIVVAALGGGAALEEPLLTAFAPLPLLLILMMAGHDWNTVLLRWWWMRELETHVNGQYDSTPECGLIGEGKLQSEHLQKLASWRVVAISQFILALAVVVVSAMGANHASCVLAWTAAILYGLFVMGVVWVWVENFKLIKRTKEPVSKTLGLA